MATFAEQREAEHQKFLETLLQAARTYAETAAPDEYFDWQKLVASTMILTPEVLREMIGERTMILRSQALSKALQNHSVAVMCVKTLLDWHTLDPDWSPERMDMGIAQEFLARVIVSVHLFSNTPQEAAYLVWRLIAAMIMSYGAEMTNGYLEQMVSGQTLLYGSSAMDDVPRSECLRRDEMIATMPERYAIPKINAPLTWAAP